MKNSLMVCSMRCGSYMGERVQRVAESFGWSGEFVSHNEEFYCEAWDEATQFLHSIPADEEGSAFFEDEDGSLIFGDAQAYYDEVDAA